MGGPNSGRRPNIMKVMKSQEHQIVPIVPTGDVMVLPNLSGDHSRGRVFTTPTTDFEIANKKYVDDNSTSPGGDDTEVQFNDGGSSFGGDAGLTYNKDTDSLTILGDLTVGDASGDQVLAFASSTVPGFGFQGATTTGITIGGSDLRVIVAGTTSIDFANTSTAIDPNIQHSNDPNTGISWGPATDNLTLSAGGIEFIRLRETTQDELVINDLGLDIDLRVESDGNENAIFLRGSDSAIGMGAVPETNVGASNLQLEGGVLVLKETTTPTADASYGKLYTKSDNELYFQDGAGAEHIIHGDAFSNIWFHDSSTVDVTISAIDTFTKITAFTVVGKEDETGHCVGSSANNEIVLNADAGGEYEISFHGSITATGGADKEMMVALGIELATKLDITDVTDNTISPIVITSTAHGLNDGDMVQIADVLVNTAANGSFFVNNKTANTFEIVDLSGGATTGNGDYDEGTPTGDVTIHYPGNMIVHEEVRGATITGMSVTGLHDIANSDKLAIYVANLDGTENLTVAAVSFDCIRLGN